MSVQTSQITTASNGDLSISPNGSGQTKVNSVTAANPGVSIVAMGSDKALKDLDITTLTTKATADDADWAIIHDSVSGDMMKVSASELGGKPFDPLPGNIVDINGNPFPGAGTAASPFVLTPITRPTPGGTDETADTIRIINGTPNRIVLFSDNSPAASGARFDNRPPILLDSSGEASFKFLYSDSPATAVGNGQTYDMLMHIGGTPVYMSWAVAQQANKTSFNEGTDITASPASVNFAADNKFGTLNAVWEDGAKTLSASGDVLFGVAGGAITAANKSISAGQALQVSWNASVVNAASNGAFIAGTLAATDATYAVTFGYQKDTTPIADTVFPMSGIELSTECETQARTLFGINAPTAITLTSSTLTGVELSIAGGAYSSGPWTVNPGQTLQAKGTTGATTNTVYDAVFSVGGVTFTWNVTTVDVLPEVKTPVITQPGGVTASANSQIVSSAFEMAAGSGTHGDSDWYLYKADPAVIRSGKIVSTNGTTIVEVDSAASLTNFQVGDSVVATPGYLVTTSNLTNSLSTTSGTVNLVGGGGDASLLIVGDVVSQSYSANSLGVGYTTSKYGACYAQGNQDGVKPCFTPASGWNGYTDANAPWILHAQRPALGGRSGCIWAVQSEAGQFLRYDFTTPYNIKTSTFTVEAGSFSGATIRVTITSSTNQVMALSGNGPMSSKLQFQTASAGITDVNSILLEITSSGSQLDYATGYNAFYDGANQIIVDAIGIVSSVISPGQSYQLGNVFGAFQSGSPMNGPAKKGEGVIAGISGASLSISASNNEWIPSTNQLNTDIFVEDSGGRVAYPTPPSGNTNPPPAPWALENSSLADALNKTTWTPNTPAGSRYLAAVAHNSANGEASDLSNWKYWDV